MVLKLIYFGGPGRAEATKLILEIGKIPYEQVDVSWEEWPNLKPSTPQGYLPVLQLDDDRQIGQMHGIERYAAKLAGMYPEDPYIAALADQACFFCNDLMDVLMPAWAIQDHDSRAQAVAEALAGPFKDKMLILQKPVERHDYMTGDKFAFADISIFGLFGWIRGFEFGCVPSTLLDEYPKLKAWFNRVANHPVIKAHYANATGLFVYHQGA